MTSAYLLSVRMCPQLRKDLIQLTDDLERSKQMAADAHKRATSSIHEESNIRQQIELLQPELLCLRKRNFLLRACVTG